jgi:hypothetical protein
MLNFNLGLALINSPLNTDPRMLQFKMVDDDECNFSFLLEVKPECSIQL